jgi:hypothetical protein
LTAGDAESVGHQAVKLHMLLC